MANAVNICYSCKKTFKHKYTNNRNYCEDKEHYQHSGKYSKYRDSAYNVCNLKSK